MRAARAFGLDMAGVDLLRSADGPKVLEVNSSPGLEGIEKATGKNLAALHLRRDREARAPRADAQGAAARGTAAT